MTATAGSACRDPGAAAHRHYACSKGGCVRCGPPLWAAVGPVGAWRACPRRVTRKGAARRRGQDGGTGLGFQRGPSRAVGGERRVPRGPNPCPLPPRSLTRFYWGDDDGSQVLLPEIRPVLSASSDRVFPPPHPQPTPQICPPRRSSLHRPCFSASLGLTLPPAPTGCLCLESRPQLHSSVYRSV